MNKVFLPIVTSEYHPPKRGVVNLSTCADVRACKATWTYAYSPEPANCSLPVQGGIVVESVPMIRDPRQMQNHVGGNSEWIIGFNEPDGPEPYGSGMAVSFAVPLWKQIEDWYPDRLLVAPAPSSAATYDAGNWLHNFRAAFLSAYGKQPRFDALAAHIYFGNPTVGIAAMQDAVAHSREWGAQGVWVTEWGMPWNDPTLATLTSMRAFQNAMNAEARVLRYSWFGTRIPVGVAWYPPNWRNLSLVDDAGLTAWGKEYVR